MESHIFEIGPDARFSTRRKIIIGSRSQYKDVFTNILSSAKTFDRNKFEIYFKDIVLGNQFYFDDEVPDEAKKRALALKGEESDVCVGFCSGIVKRYQSMYVEVWCFISMDNKFYSGYSHGLEIPENQWDILYKKSFEEIKKTIQSNSVLMNKQQTDGDETLDNFRSAFRSAMISAGII